MTYQNEEPVEAWHWKHMRCERNPCEECHDEHVRDKEMVDNAKAGLRCCWDHLEMALDNGTMCWRHLEWLGKIPNGQWWCDQCGEADSQYNGHPKPKGEK